MIFVPFGFHILFPGVYIPKVPSLYKCEMIGIRERSWKKKFISCIYRGMVGEGEKGEGDFSAALKHTIYQLGLWKHFAFEWE